MDILSWKDVVSTHQTIAGISVKNGLPISILVNQRKDGIYSDQVKDTELIYVLTKDTQQRGITALLSIIGKPYEVRAFEKIDKNKWLDLGNWKAEDVIQGKDDIRIRFMR